MTPAFDRLHALLKQLPGLGSRSAERLALHLLVEKPERMAPLLETLQLASTVLRPCSRCGSLAEGELCNICADTSRNSGQLCVVESVPEVLALERAGVYRGYYHVLHGRLSPLHDVGPEQLNLESLGKRLQAEPINELILALSNDIEGEATCHYIQEECLPRDGRVIQLTRIGFGLPSGGGLGLADAATVRTALEGRRSY
ncbi:MAG: recombination mediator RecR [Opitutales bacterium]